MRKLQITAIGEPTEVLELVGFQASAPGHRYHFGAQRLSRSGGAGRRRHAERARSPHLAAGGLQRRLDPHQGDGGREGKVVFVFDD
jgi:hypothetical protein